MKILMGVSDVIFVPIPQMLKPTWNSILLCILVNGLTNVKCVVMVLLNSMSWRVTCSYILERSHMYVMCVICLLDMQTSLKYTWENIYSYIHICVNTVANCMLKADCFLPMKCHMKHLILCIVLKVQFKKSIKKITLVYVFVKLFFNVSFYHYLNFQYCQEISTCVPNLFRCF